MMSLLDGLEDRLTSLVGDAFERSTEADVVPVEIAAAIQREMDDAARAGGEGRMVTANAFLVELSGSDFFRLSSHLSILSTELATVVAEYADDQSYRLPGRPVVRLQEDESLDPGIFRVTPFAATDRRSSAAEAGGPATATGYAAPGAVAEPAAVAADAPFVPPAPVPVPGYVPPAPVPVYVPPAPPVAPAHIPPAPVPVVPAVAAAAPVIPEPVSAPVAARGRPRLVVNGAEHVLVLRETVIGRGEGADLRISDPAVSRSHLRLSIGQTIEVTDLGSTNGTRVNGVPQSHAVLTNGDVIDVGSTRLVVRTD